QQIRTAGRHLGRTDDVGAPHEDVSLPSRAGRGVEQKVATVNRPVVDPAGRLAGDDETPRGANILSDRFAPRQDGETMLINERQAPRLPLPELRSKLAELGQRPNAGVCFGSAKEDDFTLR